MSRRVPIRRIGEALISIPRDSASSFSTELVICQIASRASFFRTAAQLRDRLPALVATRGDIELSNSEQVDAYLDQAMPWDLNLLTAEPESAADDLALLDDEETLAQLFSGHRMDLTLSGEPCVEVLEVTPTGVFAHTDLQELDEPLPIAWTRLRVLVKLVSCEPQEI